VCYARVLPDTLIKMFEIASTAREVIGHVLNTNDFAIDDLLKHAGIGMVPEIEPLPIGPLEPLNEEVIANRSLLVLNRRASSQSNLPGPVRSISVALRSPSPALPEPIEFIANTAYRDLLDNVIGIAQQAAIPHRGVIVGPANGQSDDSFDPIATFGVRSQGEVNHDIKIGAAGELFVSILCPCPQKFSGC